MIDHTLLDPALRQLIDIARLYGRDPSAAHALVLQQHGLRSLTGGRNNPVYAFDHNGVTLCLKLYAVDERRRAEREWTALRFLQHHLPGIAPTPLLYDADPLQPAIIMSFVLGVPLTNHPLDPIELDALAATLQHIYAITPAIADYPWSVVGTTSSIIERTIGWSQRTIDRTDPLIASCCDLIEQWHALTDPVTLRQPAPLVFGRGDPSLANCLFDRGRVRCIDWEYSGWNDLPCEIADLIEGPWARHTSDQIWLPFADRFDLIDGVQAERFAAARRLIACFWLYKFGEQYAHGTLSAPLLTDQIERARRMLGDRR